MKIKMTVKSVSDCVDDAWEEEVDTQETICLESVPENLTPIDYANIVVDYFNSTLKPGERVREVIDAVEVK